MEAMMQRVGRRAWWWVGCCLLIGGWGVAVMPGVAAAQAAEAGAGAAWAAGGLRPAWESGQTARYEFWNRFDKVTEVQLGEKSQTQTTVTEVSGEVTWGVVAVGPDGGADCTMRLDWMRLETEVRGANGRSQKTVADSRKPATQENKAMVQLLSAMTGVTMKVRVAADGSIAEVKGRKEMEGKTDQPDFLPSVLDFVESASDLATLPFAPESASREEGPDGVAVGKSWKADFEWDHELGKIQQRWQYRLDRVEQIAGLPVAVVEGRAKLQLKPELPDRPAGAPAVQVKMTEGQVDSEILFDLTRAEAIGRHARGTETIRVSAKLPDGRQFSRTIRETSVSQTLRIGEQ